MLALWPGPTLQLEAEDRFLDLTPESSLARIKMRNRQVEAGVKIEYLRALHGAYRDFISDISRAIPVIRVNWEEFRDAEEIASMIEQEYLNGHFLRDVTWRPTLS